MASNGFHSAIGLRTADAGPVLRSLAPDRQARWMLIGWGQADFFLARRYTVATFVKGAFIPSRSALHVMPLRQPPAAALARSDVIRLEIPAEKMGAVRAHIEASLARDSGGRPVSLGRGYFQRSVFYRGRESFIFPKTCNLWSARALRAGGIPIFPPTAIVANDLVRQAAPHGEWVGRKKKPSDGF